jgi:hypothetical protein
MQHLVWIKKRGLEHHQIDVLGTLLGKPNIAAIVFDIVADHVLCMVNQEQLECR